MDYRLAGLIHRRVTIVVTRPDAFFRMKYASIADGAFPCRPIVYDDTVARGIGGQQFVGYIHVA